METTNLKTFTPFVGLRVVLPVYNQYGALIDTDDGFVTRVYKNGDYQLSDYPVDTGLCQIDNTTDGVIVGGLVKEVGPRNPRVYSRLFNRCF